MKTTQKALMKGVALLGGAVLFLSACSSTGSGGTGGEGASDAEEFVIGLALSQSGNMAPFDVEPGIAANLAIEEINESGGVNGRQIRVIEKDVASNPETVGLVVQELIDAGIHLLIGPCDFDLSAPGLIAAQSAGIPGISICAGDPKTADTVTIGDFAFSGHPGSDVEGTIAAVWAKKNGWKNAFLIRDMSIEYSKSIANYFAATFEAEGGKVVGDESFPGGDAVDVSAQINRLKAVEDEVDFVMVSSYNPGGSTVMKQIREAGIDLPLVGTGAMDGLTLPDILGTTSSDVYIMALACLDFCTGADNPDLDTFVEKFTAANNNSGPSTAYALLGYNLMLAVSNALAETDSLDGTSIRDALVAAPEFASPIGEIKYFVENCHKPMNYPMSIVALNDGEMTLVEQVRPGTSMPDLGDGNSCYEATRR